MKKKINKKIKFILIDIIISPAFHILATDLYDSSKLMNLLSSNTIYNILDYPAGIVPVGICEDTSYDDKYNYYTKSLKKNMDSSKGLPIAVQIASICNNDELVIRLMKEVDDIYGFENKLNDKIT